MKIANLFNFTLTVLLTNVAGSFNLIAQEEPDTIEIDTQIWMAENLNVDKFLNGDPIPQTKNDTEWIKANKEGTPAWCYYNNDPANGEIYGKLYNWYAINDPRGLVHKDWRVPSEEDWDKLITFLGGESEAGHKMKSTNGWNENGIGINSIGFSALPGGSRFDDGSFKLLGESAAWWSSDQFSSEYSKFYFLFGSNGEFKSMFSEKSRGFSVRLISNWRKLSEDQKEMLNMESDSKSLTRLDNQTIGYSLGTYNGQTINRKPDGKGVYTWNDGAKYEGEWKDGKMNGQGTYVWENEDNKYVGQWKDGKMNGYGELEKGLSFLPDIYKGEFRDGEFYGQGVLIMTLGLGGVYEGQFKEGEFHGQGTYEIIDNEGEDLEFTSNWEFAGNWVNGRLNGKTNEDIDKLVEENGHFYARKTFSNGNVYVGEWKNGTFHGQGTYTNKYGRKFSGVWSLGMLNGESIEDLDNQK